MNRRDFNKILFSSPIIFGFQDEIKQEEIPRSAKIGNVNIERFNILNKNFHNKEKIISYSKINLYKIAEYDTSKTLLDVITETEVFCNKDNPLCIKLYTYYYNDDDYRGVTVSIKPLNFKELNNEH